MMRLRWLAPFLLCLGLAGTMVTPVQAHAVLVRSVPAANAILASAPGQVELFFSEVVDPRLSKVQVLGAQGSAVSTGELELDPRNGMHLSIRLPRLADGVYVVTWEIVSATDGHQTDGSFPFSVGKASAEALARASQPGSAPAAPLGGMVLKGLLYLAAAALMGHLLFTVWVWSPAVRQTQVSAGDFPGRPRLERALITCALVLLTGAQLLSWMFQAGQDSGGGISWPWQPTFLILVLSTRVGILGLARLAIGALLAIIFLSRPAGWKTWVGLGACLALMLTFSLESHAAADPAPALPLLADWAHMLAVSIWVGGLFSFLTGMALVRRLAPETRTRLTAVLIPHFSNLALASVAVLTVSGIYAAGLRLGDLDALWATQYGQALVLKLVIALAMVGLGAVNFLYTSPHMQRAAAQPGGNPRQVARFSRLLAGEVALGVLILIWVGVFTSLPPARTALTSTGYQAFTQADDLKISLSVDPAQAGINTFTARISSGGLPLLNAQEVSLEIAPLSGMIPPAKATMTPAGLGTYKLTGGYLAMPEPWDVKVVVIRATKFDAYADFKIDLGQMQ